MQLGGVQLYVVLIMLRTRRALDCAVSAVYSWDMRAWRMFCHAYSLWDAARLVVLMLDVLAILLDTKDAEVNLDAGCIEMTSVDLNALDVDVILKRSSKGASESSGRNRDSEFVYCYYEERQRAFECHRKRRNHDMGLFKGSKKSKSKRKEQERVQGLSRVRQVWSGCEIQRSERVRSKQEKLGRSEMRHGERRSECAGDWSSVVAREKSQDSGWHRFVHCGTECSKGERQAPRCVILVRGSENGRDVRSLGGSVRERHESRCVLPLFRRMWNETGESSDCQSWIRKDHNATSGIATNEERPRPCSFHKMRGPVHQAFRVL